MIQNPSKELSRYNKDNQKLKIAIVRSNYYPSPTKSLEGTCREYLVAFGVKADNITTFQVPGSWEIPLIVKKIASSKKFDGIIAFGIIIKGETYHFEILSRECARALMNISLEFNIPITFEVLAVYNMKQARERSLGKNNKGIEAAKTLLSTIQISSSL